MEAHSMAIAYETATPNWRTQPAPDDDYARIKAAIGYLTLNHRAQPGLDEIASHVGLSPSHFQRLFKRWAGLSPKAFLQAVTLDHARRLLEDSASVLDAAYEVGLSGPGRLHDLFVNHVALSPGEYKSKGVGLTLHWGFHPSPFGLALAVVTERGLAGLGFADHEQDRQDVLADMDRPLAARPLHRGSREDGTVRAPDFRPRRLALRHAAAHLADRLGFRNQSMGGAASDPVRTGYDLFGCGPAHRQAQCITRCRRSGRAQSHLFCGALSSRARPHRRAVRLSLGPDPQAGHARLGGGRHAGRTNRTLPDHRGISTQ
jgi:AraC-like DNA-binding protein